MNRPISLALIGTAGLAQALASVSGTHAAGLAKSAMRTFKGTTIQTQHGPVGVSIGVRSKRIVKVAASIAPRDDGRSPFLQERAIPVLKEESLKAQSASVDTVSGATETSEAFIASLQSAIKKAQKAKALA
jgi:uncharacterized protein with FMN-binding domain